MNNMTTMQVEKEVLVELRSRGQSGQSPNNILKKMLKRGGKRASKS